METELVSLVDSLQPLREHFNGPGQRPCFLAVLSPT
jgi:hypothetical protein